MELERIAEPVGRRGGPPDATAPDGSEVRVLVEAAHGAARSSVCEVTLGPGLVSRPVAHRSVEEAWYVLSGSGRVWRRAPGAAEGFTCDVGPGDALAIPVGWSFQFSAGPDGLSFLCHTTPPWPGEDEARAAGAGGLGKPTA